MFTLSFSKVYYSKVEPYEIRDISSNVSGLVLYVDENSIGKKLSKSAYIEIDSELDKQELKFIEDKLVYLKKIISANEAVLINLENSLDKKRENYKKIESLKIKSVVEKDREFHDLINSENQFLNTQKEIENLKVQITDLKLKEVYLRRSISDKNLTANGFTLYSILVKPGQVVAVSTPLARVADISKALLTIYLDEPDVKDAKKKVVYIDGEKTSYKISRLLNIADSKNISKYMAQIVIKSPKLFSKLVKIELRDE
ncbi:MAG: HlyD family secretion protein [Campylobacterota bacterium]|nr:HlyD family secretion protein [Campylobacterota bacterium]